MEKEITVNIPKSKEKSLFLRYLNEANLIKRVKQNNLKEVKK